MNDRLRYGKPIFLAIAFGAFNQLSGINAILYYLGDIFSAAGFSGVSGNMQSIAIGAMNLMATLVGWRRSTGSVARRFSSSALSGPQSAS